MFESLDKNDRQGIAKRLASLLVSICLHVVIVSLVIVLPLIFLNVMPEGILLSFLMAEPVVPKAPEPPVPPVPGAEKVQKVIAEVVHWDQKPTRIPDRIPAPTDDVIAYSPGLVNVGDRLGTVGGGVLAGTPGPPAWLVTAPPPLLLPAPASPRHELVRTGGSVQEAKLIRRVVPEYPALAKNARIQDMVLLEVTLDEEGNVATIRIIKGHPLLVEEAVRAVTQWKYSPTLLNGEPVPVISTVTVIFRLN